MNHMKHYPGLCGLVLLYVLTLTSCGSTKQATYFNEITDTALVAATNIPEPVIHRNDLLSISVSSLNPEAALLFNTSNIPGGGTKKR
jgi:polysaccharide export outer membrane protein